MALLVGLAGCSANKERISVTPTPMTLTTDSAGVAPLDLTLHVPAHYLSKRARLIVNPELMQGDSLVASMQPVVVDAPIFTKKTIRKTVLEGYVDPYALQSRKLLKTSRAFTVPMSDKVQLPEGVDSARLIGVVTSDGCGKCTGMDTLLLAEVVRPVIPEVVKETLNLTWIEPEFEIKPKIMEGEGVANLQFIINRYDIKLDLGDNKSELDRMVAVLEPILSDTLATLTSLEIYGVASADGPLRINIPLSRNRAESAKKWLVERLNIPAGIAANIKIGSHPEGWQPVLDAMVADNHPGAADIRAILERYREQNDDVAEKYIRRSKWWNDIKNRYLQKDRKVEYKYKYTVRSFTQDAELIEMYSKRPDAFNEQEFLRVAQLAKGDDSRMEVYKTMLRYFPKSRVAANNLALLYEARGDIETARKVLEDAGVPIPDADGAKGDALQEGGAE